MTTLGNDGTAPNVDVTIHIAKSGNPQAEAVINRDLVRLLCLIRETGSMREVCERTCCSERKVQRMLKRFTDATGLKLLHYHGPHGTELAPAGKQCIILYSAALRSVQRIAEEQGLPGAPAMDMYASVEDGKMRMGTAQLKGRARDPTGARERVNPIND